MESILEILSYVWWVLLAIMILVFVHEMGHFLFAKLFKMRVDRFSVGFPPKIFGKKIGETEYVLGATPLGGYVKIAGMVDESLDAGELESEPQPWEFRAKPVWQRVIVITAGVIFNIVLAFGIFAGLKYAYGETYIPAENIEAVFVEDGTLAHDMGLRTGDQIVAVNGEKLERLDGPDVLNMRSLAADRLTITVQRSGENLTFEAPDDIMTRLNRSGGRFGTSYYPSLVGNIIEGSAAAEAGLQAGDRIVALGGEPLRFWNEMTQRIQVSEGAPMVVRWIRPDSLLAVGEAKDATTRPVATAASGQVFESTLTPQEEEGRYYIGIYPPTEDMLLSEFGVRHDDYSLGEAFVAGAGATWTNTSLIVTSLKRVFTGRDSFRENVGGPIMIAKVTKQAADAGASVFWNIVAMLSITLAIMNILPIPALDGGHLVFLLYEGITRREPSLKVRMALQQVGMVLLLAFMVFVIFNDILRL